MSKPANRVAEAPPEPQDDFPASFPANTAPARAAAATARLPWLLATLSIDAAVGGVLASDLPADTSTPTGETPQQSQSSDRHSGTPTQTVDPAHSRIVPDQVDRIDLNQHDFDSLQTLLERAARPGCDAGGQRFPVASRVSCHWKVLSLVRHAPADAPPDRQTGFRSDESTHTELDRTTPASGASSTTSPDTFPAQNLGQASGDSGETAEALPKPTTNSAAVDIVSDTVAPAADSDTPRAGQRFSNRVPAGFETVAIRKRTDVDVHIDGEPRLRTPISFDIANFTFDDPAAVAQATIDALGLANRAELERFFSSSQPVSVDDVCLDDQGPRDCISREPLPYATLTDLGSARVDIIVREDIRPFRGESLTRLPPARDGLSWQASTDLAATAITDQGTHRDVRAGASVSYGAGGLFGTGSYSSTDELSRINELYLAHQFRDHEARAGTQTYRGNGLLLNQRILGVGFSRSLKTYTDRRALFSTPIDVQLDSRSVVQLVVDGEVRYSTTLNAGLQRLDTSSLPQGTYTLEIRIRDADNGLRVEQQLFTRTAILPPPNTPLYGVLAGTGRDAADDQAVPSPDGEVFFSGYTARRFSNGFGARLEATQYADASAAQIQLMRIGNRYQLQLGGLVGSHSALGTALQAAYRGRRINLLVQGMRFQSEADLTADPALARFLRPDITQAGISTSYRKGRYTLNLRADHTQTTFNDGPGTRNQFSATLRRQLSGGALSGSTISAQYVDDGQDQQIELRLTVFAREQDLAHTATAATRKDIDGQWRPEVGYTATYEPGKIDSDELGTSRWIGTVHTTAREDSSLLGASVRLVDQHYDLGIGADIVDEQSDRLTYRGLLTASTQIAGNREAWSFGRHAGSNAGVIVDVGGEPTGEPFDIIVNGSRHSVGRIGSRQFLSLPAYNTHEIQLIPRSLVFNGFNQNTGSHTLYPGNVHTLQLEAENRYLLITSIVDNDGDVLRNVRIDNRGEAYLILEDGVVQIEVRPFDTLDIDLGNGEDCSIVAPDPGEQDILIQDAPMLCL